MKVSNNLFEFHKLVEGVHHKAYLDPVGILTIGIGHANQDTAKFDEDSEWDDQTIKDVWLKDIATAERLANEYLDGAEIEQPYFDALVDIIFNTGAKPTTMLKCLHNGQYEAARDQLIRWVYSQGVVLLGLVKRRFVMYAYCGGDENWLDLANVPLSSNNLDDFNQAILDTGYQVIKIDDDAKFTIERGQ